MTRVTLSFFYMNPFKMLVIIRPTDLWRRLVVEPDRSLGGASGVAASMAAGAAVEFAVLSETGELFKA